jgi:isochorismate synthase
MFMTTDITIFPKTHYRQRLWQTANTMKFPAAMWRLPRQNEKYFLTNFSYKPTTTKIDFEELGEGFAISPFINPENKAAFFLKADLCFVFDKNEDFDEIISPSPFDATFSEFQSIVNSELSSNSLKVPVNEKRQINDNEVKGNEHLRFTNIVEKGISAIRAGEMQKVVLSRTKEIILDNDFEVFEAFDKLCSTYPNAFVSVVSLPHLGIILMGASPERLVSQDKNGIFRTMALAATQSAFDKDGQPIVPSEAMWRQKEIEEQSLVCRYIINCFKKIRLREYDEEGPKTTIAGNLMHLQTDFIVDTQFVNFPQLASVMLELLHPTSAVCGMPKTPATQFILENEGYDREFYSGFLGPINIDQESHIFVNLRTMKLQKKMATLYAGCGITADSNPEKEWLETEMKCQTLLDIIDKNI